MTRNTIVKALFANLLAPAFEKAAEERNWGKMDMMVAIATGKRATMDELFEVAYFFTRDVDECSGA